MPTHRFGLTCLSRWAGWAYWSVNLAALLAIGLWVCRDGKFPEAALGLHRALTTDQSVPYSPLLAPRVQVLQAALLVGLVSGAGVLLVLFAGSPSHRNLRAWLAALTLCAAWLALLVGWSELAWRARGWRIGRDISSGWFRSEATVDEFAESLRANWPSQDGASKLLGPFSAYPLGKPTTLMLAQAATVPGSHLMFNAVERDPANHLHFQLTGSEAGVWLVQSEGAPQSFFSGLAGEYQPRRSRKVGDGWWMVEYHFSPLVSVPHREPRF